MIYCLCSSRALLKDWLLQCGANDDNDNRLMNKFTYVCVCVHEIVEIYIRVVDWSGQYRWMKNYSIPLSLHSTFAYKQLLESYRFRLWNTREYIRGAKANFQNCWSNFFCMKADNSYNVHVFLNNWLLFLLKKKKAGSVTQTICWCHNNAQNNNVEAKSQVLRMGPSNTVE